jgi:hypothetical protein
MIGPNAAASERIVLLEVLLEVLVVWCGSFLRESYGVHEQLQKKQVLQAHQKLANYLRRLYNPCSLKSLQVCQ